MFQTPLSPKWVLSQESGDFVKTQVKLVYFPAPATLVPRSSSDSAGILSSGPRPNSRTCVECSFPRYLHASLPTSFWWTLQSPSQWGLPLTIYLKVQPSPPITWYFFSALHFAPLTLVTLKTLFIFCISYRNVQDFCPFYSPLQFQCLEQRLICISAQWLLNERMVDSFLKGSRAEQKQAWLVIFPKFAILSDLPFPKAEWRS